MQKKDIVQLPYFDYLFASLQANDALVEKSFGRHVHWGYWDQPQQATGAADDFAAAAEQLTAQLCRAANIQNGQRILDAGCGFGGTIAHLNENYRDMTLTGLNLDGRQLVRARQQVQAQQSNKIHFHQGNACQLPFADASFDVVLAVECIFHFPSRQQFFQEAHRVLKPGGCLTLSDFVPNALAQPFTRIKFSAPFNVGFYGNCNVQCSAEQYRLLANQCGFNVLVDRDITRNTLPTYSFLRTMGSKTGLTNFAAAFETLTLEMLSRTRLLNYWIFSLIKN
jgi:ubiquinone/menaquinone biosynthesis C-methylase UbiE